MKSRTTVLIVVGVMTAWAVVVVIGSPRERRRLLDRIEWTAAQTIGSPRLYLSYIQHHPKGRHIERARTRYEEMAWAAPTAVNDEASRQAALAHLGVRNEVDRQFVEELTWSRALALNAVAGYESYQALFPQGRFRAFAEFAVRSLTVEHLRGVTSISVSFQRMEGKLSPFINESAREWVDRVMSRVAASVRVTGLKVTFAQSTTPSSASSPISVVISFVPTELGAAYTDSSYRYSGAAIKGTVEVAARSKVLSRKHFASSSEPQRIVRGRRPGYVGLDSVPYHAVLSSLDHALAQAFGEVWGPVYSLKLACADSSASDRDAFAQVDRRLQQVDRSVASAGAPVVQPLLYCLETFRTGSGALVELGDLAVDDSLLLLLDARTGVDMRNDLIDYLQRALIKQGPSSRTRSALRPHLAMLARGCGSCERLSLLTRAAAAGDPDLVNALLAIGERPRQEEDGTSTLVEGLGNGIVVEALLRAGAEPKAARPGGMPPLHIAARRGHVDAMSHLLAHGADIDAIDAVGNTALHEAVQSHQVQAVRLLVANGASRTVRNRSGYTAVDLTAHGEPRHPATREMREALQQTPASPTRP